MRKIFLAISILLASATIAQAKLKYGVQWGYCPALASYEHCNFKTDIGYRVENTEKNLIYDNNASLEVFAEYHFNPHFSAGLSVGKEGFKGNSSMFPLSLRLRYIPKTEGSFLLLQAGCANQQENNELALPFGLFYGYRTDLGLGISLDAMVGAKLTQDLCKHYSDPYYGNIPTENIVHKRSFLAGIGVYLSLSF